MASNYEAAPVVPKAETSESSGGPLGVADGAAQRSLVVRTGPWKLAARLALTVAVLLAAYAATTRPWEPAGNPPHSVPLSPETDHAALHLSPEAIRRLSQATCTQASGAIAEPKHTPPTEGSVLSKVAFSSCFDYAGAGRKVWSHVRERFGAELWAWLGDNVYSDGVDMQLKRDTYNEARTSRNYLAKGPLAEPQIPVVATWDDHDFAWNNEGGAYQCTMLSQNEFVHHFGIPSSDARHPDQGASQQMGVYGSTMFSAPDQSNGVHVIMVDARSGRDPTYPQPYKCEGASTQMLSPQQWDWLEQEFSRTSEIKVVGSGIQVLPPTNRDRALTAHCACRGRGGEASCNEAIADVGENSTFYGTWYESWGEIPSERRRLLRLAQKSIASGNAKQVVFISGDQHWAEIMAKRMPTYTEGGITYESVVLHEVTASGIDQSWDEEIPNSNRLRVRTADYYEDGDFQYECKFPFTYGGVVYSACTAVEHHVPWCYTKSDNSRWGNCMGEELELFQAGFGSQDGTCTDSSMHVCTAKANYGGIEVDWDAKKVKLSIFTPHDSNNAVAQHVIDF